MARPHAARTADEAVAAAQGLGYPVVVKIDSPQISHKTEVNGVVLNLPNDAAVREAFEQTVRRGRADAARRGNCRRHGAEDDDLPQQLSN